MIKKTTLLLILFSSFFNIQIRASIPEEFYVNERIFGLTAFFDVETKDRKLGTIYKKFFALTPEYYFNDPFGNLISRGKMRFWNLGAVFDVTDSNGKPLGRVEEKLTSIFQKFYIISPTEQILANAELNFWGTKYRINDPIDNHPIAVLSRPFFQFKNDWTVNILDPNAISEKAIHPDLFLIIIAFQVDYEDWVAHASSSRSAICPKKQSHSAIVKDLQKILEQQRTALINIESQNEDFTFVETLAENYTIADEEAFYNCAAELISMLSSDQLTLAQRKALLLMLELRISSL